MEQGRSRPRLTGISRKVAPLLGEWENPQKARLIFLLVSAAQVREASGPCG